ncbi:DUF3492 domain-containing protein [Streptomyces sp. CA-294286]|uniref:DUF3492 domain-containing protein n=1 Tax=Streptomyces sp. CA-294286 TaxID=3240070 RepID=UPI003D8E4819
MRIGLLTEGGYPFATGESRFWCDRLVRGLTRHEFDVYALSRSEEQEEQGWVPLPPQVQRVRTAPLWSSEADFRTSYGRLGARSHGRRERQRFDEHFGALVSAVCAGETPGARVPGPTGTGPAAGAASVGERFAAGLYGLAELAREKGGVHTALRSERAVRTLERACRAPGAPRVVQTAKVSDHLVLADLLERILRPLSLDWCDEGEGGLGAVDLCHAASAGAAALPGLLAKRFFGVPLLVTEYGVQLRAHYLAAQEAELTAPVRTLLAGFHGLLAAEVYAQAAVITPGNAHARRWQERCGADRAKLRTVYPGMDPARFAAVGETDGTGADGTLVWVGRIEPAKDLVALLHAFAEVRAAEPGARLRLVSAPVTDASAAAYLAHCRALAEHLFPDEAADARTEGESPVLFEELGGAGAPEPADAYASGSVVVLSSVVEGFPISLVEALFCGRATVSTDVGAVVEVVGGTGLVVPPRNPRALADACLALLRDPDRRARLGAAGRARALELFTVEQNLAAFRDIYLELVSRCPVRREPADGEPLPFALAAEAYVPGSWTGGATGARATGSGGTASSRAGADGTTTTRARGGLAVLTERTTKGPLPDDAAEGDPADRRSGPARRATGPGDRPSGPVQRASVPGERLTAPTAHPGAADDTDSVREVRP